MLDAVLDGADCVVHCAAKSGAWGEYRTYQAANVEGTRNLLDACREHRVGRIVFLSTPSVYDTGRDRLEITEEEPLPDRQLSWYSRTKLTAEQEMLASAGADHRVIVLRPRAVYGPHDSIIVPTVLRLAQQGKLPLINGGDALIDVTAVDNLVDAIRLSLEAPDPAWNRVYNITNGEPITMREWFALILETLNRPYQTKVIREPLALAAATVMELLARLSMTGREPRLTRFKVRYLARSMTLCIDSAKTRLGYHPQIGNRQGMERYASWFRTLSA
jgi:nucleoside-diphosphate-sugar epimerase